MVDFLRPAQPDAYRPGVTVLHMMSHSNVEPVGTTDTPGGPCPAVQADPVLLAAYEALITYGPSRATLTDVAKRAGVSRMTVYRRYDTLSRLMSAVLTAELGSLLATASDEAREGNDAQRLSALVAEASRLIAEHPLMSQLLTLEPESLLPVIVQRRGSTQMAAEAALAGLIAASTDGSVHITDPAQAARTLVTAASGFVFGSSRRDGSGADWTEIERLCLGYLSGGLS